MNSFQPDIWRLQTEENISGLVSALSHDDADVRRRAAAALRALGAHEALAPLRAALESEADSATRSSLLSALATLERERDRQHDTGALPDLNAPRSPFDEKLETMIKLLQSTDVSQISNAARILGELGDKRAVEPLVMLFIDTGTPIRARLAVAEALLKLESAPVEVSLLGALRSPDWKTRRNGAAILGQLRAEWALEPLAGALFDANDIVRRTALAALQRIGTAEAKAAIQQARRRARQARAKEQPSPEPSPADDTQRIVWPRRRGDPTMAPTRPLDPNTLANLDNRPDNDEKLTD